MIIGSNIKGHCEFCQDGRALTQQNRFCLVCKSWFEELPRLLAPQPPRREAPLFCDKLLRRVHESMNGHPWTRNELIDRMEVLGKVSLGRDRKAVAAKRIESAVGTLLTRLNSRPAKYLAIHTEERAMA